MQNLLLLFGGKSLEHEISIISARFIFSHINKAEFDILLVIIAKDGTWYLLHDQALIDAIHTCPDIESIHQTILTTRYVRTGIHEEYDASININEYVEECVLCPNAYLATKSGRKLQISIAFPILHGTLGEDGAPQGYFEMCNVPYVGSGIAASAICMNKITTRTLLEANGIATVPHIAVKHSQIYAMPSYEEASQKLQSEKLLVKPAQQGSSIGVHIISSRSEYDSAIATAIKYGDILIDKCIIGRELECSILSFDNNVRAADAIAEICISQKHKFYSYEAKYLDPDGAVVLLPAPLCSELVKSLQNAALRAFIAIGCCGMARVDFFAEYTQDNMSHNDTKYKIYVNEINTTPGFTNISAYPKSWIESGVDANELIRTLILSAYQLHK